MKQPTTVYQVDVSGSEMLDRCICPRFFIPWFPPPSRSYWEGEQRSIRARLSSGSFCLGSKGIPTPGGFGYPAVLRRTKKKGASSFFRFHAARCSEGEAGPPASMPGRDSGVRPSPPLATDDPRCPPRAWLGGAQKSKF